MFGLISPKRPSASRTVGVAGSPDIRLHPEQLEDRSCPATLIWTGGGNDGGLWSNAKNWDNTTAAPTADDSLVFDGNTSQSSSSQDILANTTADRITFENGYNGTLTVPNLLSVRNLGIGGT